MMILWHWYIFIQSLALRDVYHTVKEYGQETRTKRDANYSMSVCYVAFTALGGPCHQHVKKKLEWKLLKRVMLNKNKTTIREGLDGRDDLRGGLWS